MTIRERTSPPNLPRLYGRAVLTGLYPRALTGRGGAELPADELTLTGVTVDRDRLGAYDAVCGFRLTDTLPATYPHVLGYPLAVALMVTRPFPFPLVGLVHIRNVITQHRPVDAGEPLGLRVWAERLGPHERGRQVDLVTEARVGGETVWTDRGTYLSRRRTSRSGRPADSGPDPRPAQPARSAQPAPSTAPPPPAAVWRVPANTGRRYAAVSGDRNPIHLYAATARLFGFRSAIAHGMWTKARCLAALEGRLPDAYTVDARFKLPILLPATVAFTELTEPAGPTERGRTDRGRTRRPAGLAFTVHDAATGRPHLTGTVTPG